MHPYSAWHVSPCLTSTPTIPCIPTVPTYTITVPVIYPCHALYPHHGDMYHLHTWHVPLLYLTWTTTMPTCSHHHAWHVQLPCLTYTHHHTWHMQPPSLVCTTTMPDMFTGALRIELGSSCMWSELSADWGFSSAQLLSPRWPTEFI